MTDRREVVVSVEEAVAGVDSGATIAIGGLGTSSHPMAAIRQLIRNGIRDLTVVAGPMASLEVDLLIAAGCVSELVTSYVGAERLAPIGPAFRRAAEEGQISVREVDEGIYCQALGAAARMLPFATWRGGMGTSLVDLNPDLKVIDDPFGGPPVLAVRALPVDVAFLHAAHADRYGNVQPVGTGFADRLHHQAAQRTVVQVEQIISNEEVRRSPWFTSMPDASAIVRTPFGSHPFASPGFYVEDEGHITEYVGAVRGGPKTTAEYLDRYVFGCEDHLVYCERVGLRRLLSLQEYA